MLKHLALDQMLWALTGLLPQSNATSVESLWNNNQDFFGFGVITTGLEPCHISIGCGFFQLKRLGIRCAILVFYEVKPPHRLGLSMAGFYGDALTVVFLRPFASRRSGGCDLAKPLAYEFNHPGLNVLLRNDMQSLRPRRAVDGARIAF